MSIDEFLTYLKNEKRYSPHTILAYKKDLEQFEAFMDVAYEQAVLDAKPLHVRSWIVELVEVDDLTPNSINRKISSLSSLFKYALKSGYGESNPVSNVKPPKRSKRLPEFVDKGGMTQLFSGDEIFLDDFEGRRDRAIVSLFYQTGMRLSELIALSIADIDLERGTVKVLGKGNKERVCPLHTETINDIKQYLELRETSVQRNCEALFLTAKGKEVYPSLVYKLVKRALASVSTLKKTSPHILRHTFATHMLNNGADLNTIKELLGHSSLAATQVYTHNSFEQLKKIHKQAHPRA